MKQNIILFLISISSLLLVQCAGTSPHRQVNKKNIEFLIRQGKMNWEQRSDTTSFKNAEHFIALACEQRPNDFELHVLQSRIIYTRALFFEKNQSTQETLFLEGSNVARNAVLTHPDFSKIYETAMGDGQFKMMSAIMEAPQSVVPGLFWWATNLARHLNTKPVIERLNHRELVEVMMHRIITFEPGFHYSGPYRFFGSLYTRIPGVELSQSETYFNQAIETHSAYLGNHVHMAEFYYQKSGNREKFHATLMEVIQTDISPNPEMMAENLFYQDRAKYLLEKEPSLFE